jgi:hypothetical protein
MLLNRLFVSWAIPALMVSFAIRASSIGSDVSVNPPFSIQQDGSGSWLAKPNGERFFSLGVCCVAQGPSRTEFDANNPAYAAWRHYDDSKSWAEATLKRLRSWGFTTIGGWSDFHVLKEPAEKEVAFAPVCTSDQPPVLHGGTCGIRNYRPYGFSCPRENHGVAR